MYALADFYQVEELKELAKNKFIGAVELGWKSDQLGAALHTIFTTTPSTDRGLRDVAVSILRNHIEVVDLPSVSSVLREIPDLAFEALRAHRDTMRKGVFG
jgi:hypothetical protein